MPVVIFLFFCGCSFRSLQFGRATLRRIAVRSYCYKVTKTNQHVMLGQSVSFSAYLIVRLIVEFTEQGYYIKDSFSLRTGRCPDIENK